jgi:aminopeptidase N
VELDIHFFSDEISEIFDRISYGKGASIIRMMDKFLTTNTFRSVLPSPGCD